MKQPEKAQHTKAFKAAWIASRPFSDLKTGITYNSWYEINLGTIVK